jgi:Na+/melibiose symporter-like transporter
VLSSNERGPVGVIIGCLSSLTLRRIVLRVFNASYATVLTHEGFSLEERRARMNSEPIALAMGLAFDLAAIFVGGFVAARIAGHHQLSYSAGAGVLTMIFLLALLACCSVLNEPRLYTVLAFVFTIPSAVAGGYVARRTIATGVGRMDTPGGETPPPGAHA